MDLGVPSTSNPLSFNVVVKNKFTHPNDLKPSPIHNAYMVEHDEELLMVEITMLDIGHVHLIY